MGVQRIIARLDIKGDNLVKGVHLEGLRVLGKPWSFAKYYYENVADELIFKDGKLDGVQINVDSDKAKSARVKIEEWNIPKEEIVVIVDGANDIKLFDISNLGIAYRAQDLVKNLATTNLEEKDLAKIIPIINEHFSIKLPIPISS